MTDYRSLQRTLSVGAWAQSIWPGSFWAKGHLVLLSESGRLGFAPEVNGFAPKSLERDVASVPESLRLLCNVASGKLVFHSKSFGSAPCLTESDSRM